MKLLISLFIALLTFNSVEAAMWENSCLDNETMLREINYTIDGDNILVNQSLNCPLGCESDLGKYGADCIEPPYVLTLIVLGGITLMFFLIVAIGRRR